MADKRRWTVCCDFDAVIHAYTSPWVAPHVIPDPPVEGAIDWLWTMLQKFNVVIFTTRGRTWRGRRAVRRWLYRYGQGLWYEGMGSHGLEEIKVTDRKLAALIYLDDRAVRFTGPGSFPSVDAIFRLEPWNRVEKKRAEQENKT